MAVVTLRLPGDLIADLRDAAHALGRPSVSDLVRDGLRDYLAQHARAVAGYRRFRRAHDSTAEIGRARLVKFDNKGKDNKRKDNKRKDNKRKDNKRFYWQVD